MQTKQKIRKAIRSARRQLRIMEAGLREVQENYVIAGDEAEKVMVYQLTMQVIREERDKCYKMLR
ncbi:MAG: hypothetical protein AABX65_01340 [Nanoarchaeota archaeon]